MRNNFMRKSLVFHGKQLHEKVFGISWEQLHEKYKSSSIINNIR